MPTYVLQPNDSRDLDPRPLELRLHGRGARDCRVTLVRDGYPVPAQEMRAAGDTTILTRPARVPASSVLRLVPVGSEVFPADCRVELGLTEIQRSSDPMQLRVEAVLSGLPSIDLIDLSWRDDALRVRVLEVGSPPPDRPVARRAYELTRTALGRAGVGAGSTDVTVIVDPSTSMAGWIRDGALSAAIDLLAGVDYVVGRDSALEVRIGQNPQEWRFPSDEAADGVHELLTSTAGGDGVLTAPGSGPGHASVLITDLAPAEWAPAPRDACLVLCDPSAAALVATGPNVLPMAWTPAGAEAWLEGADIGDLVRQLVSIIVDGDTTKGDLQ